MSSITAPAASTRRPDRQAGHGEDFSYQPVAESRWAEPAYSGVAVPRSVLAPLALACLCVIASAPGRARADVLVALDYQTDPALAACPGPAEFRAAVARQLGHDPFRDDASRRMVVRLNASGARIEGRIEWRDASDQLEGERTFSSRNETCPRMARAMALATAIQIQLLALAEPAGEAEPPPVVEVPVIPIVPMLPPPAPIAPVVPRAAPEPRLGIEAGVAVMQDVGGSPATVAPRIAVSVGRPSIIDVRLAASGFGPTAEVKASEGSAQVDRIVVTLQLLHFFRAGRRVEPFVALGGGWQELRVHGFSLDPLLGQAHDSQSSAFLALAGGGFAVSFARGLYALLEVEGTLYRPGVIVQIGPTDAAHFGGEGVLAHGGLLARF
jgi:hypothetical protein